jgi:hypothetical protein
MNLSYRSRTAVPALTYLLPAILLASLSASALAAEFNDDFHDKTMRLDYFHTGGPGGEVISLDQVVADGAWAGSRTRLIDTTNLGTYLFQVKDGEDGRILYTRGFASLYGEWATTGEMQAHSRTFHESLRFPWPRRQVQVNLLKRDPEGIFMPLWSTPVDPGSRFVNPENLSAEGIVWAVLENGAPHEKVDLVLLGEGYTAEEMDKFHQDVKRLVDRLFATEPFSSRKTDFNVWAIDLPSSRSGVNRPHVGEFRRNPVGTTYNIFDSERYLLNMDNRRLRDVLSAAPYEYVEILVNEKQYGGGGIYNSQATTSVDTAFAAYVFIHEFGHHFAGLADEYYTSPVAYETGGSDHPEPWEPNVTALHDPDQLKWKDLVAPETPVPTPWDKDRYEKHAREIRQRRGDLITQKAPESDFDRLFTEQQKIETRMLGEMKYSGQVGAFEGAGYEAQGLYRPATDCIMFTRDEVDFCAVCQRGIHQVIDLYARP